MHAAKTSVAACREIERSEPRVGAQRRFAVAPYVLRSDLFESYVVGSLTHCGRRARAQVWPGEIGRAPHFFKLFAARS